MKRQVVIIFVFMAIVLFGVLVFALKRRSGDAAPIPVSSNSPSVKGDMLVISHDDAVQFVVKFFDDYLKNDYETTKWSPEIEYVNDHYKVSDSYISTRSGSGLFSEGYLLASRIIIEKCNEGLIGVKKAEVQKWGGAPASLATDDSCNFVFRTPFVDGTRVPLDTVVSLGSKEQHGGAIVVVGLRWSRSSLNDRFAKVNLVKESGAWKIDNIQIFYTKPSL